jgi:hypothetical protein
VKRLAANKCAVCLYGTRQQQRTWFFCSRMQLLFSWQRRAWKERCSRDCFYNGTAATAAGYLTGLTRLTDTSGAANMAGLLEEEEEGFSFPI